MALLVEYLPGCHESLTSVLSTGQTRSGGVDLRLIFRQQRQGDERFNAILNEFEASLSTLAPESK